MLRFLSDGKKGHDWLTSDMKALYQFLAISYHLPFVAVSFCWSLIRPDNTGAY